MAAAACDQVLAEHYKSSAMNRSRISFRRLVIGNLPPFRCNIVANGKAAAVVVYMNNIGACLVPYKIQSKGIASDA